MVGKYVDLTESYKSLTEALRHAGIHTESRVNIEYVDSEEIEQHGTGALAQVRRDPGAGRLRQARRRRQDRGGPLCARKQDSLPRHLPGHAGRADRIRAQQGGPGPTRIPPSSTPNTDHPVVALITEWQNHDGKVEKRDANSDLGGTMRLGAQTCAVKPGTLAAEIYGSGRDRASSPSLRSQQPLPGPRRRRPAWWWRRARRPKTCAKSWNCRAAATMRTRGTWACSTIRNSSPRRATATRCSSPSSRRRWRTSRPLC